MAWLWHRLQVHIMAGPTTTIGTHNGRIVARLQRDISFHSFTWTWTWTWTSPGPGHGPGPRPGPGLHLDLDYTWTWTWTWTSPGPSLGPGPGPGLHLDLLWVQTPPEISSQTHPPMSQGTVEPNSCPTFEVIARQYISGAGSPEESTRRSEEIRVKKAEFYKKLLKRIPSNVAVLIAFLSSGTSLLNHHLLLPPPEISSQNPPTTSSKVRLLLRLRFLPQTYLLRAAKSELRRQIRGPNANDPESNWTTSRFQLDSTWTTPGSHLDSTWTTPGSQLDYTWNSTWTTPGSHLDYTWISPGLHLDSTWITPGSHLDYTWRLLPATCSERQGLSPTPLDLVRRAERALLLPATNPTTTLPPNPELDTP